MALGIPAVSSHTAAGELVVNLVLGGENAPERSGQCCANSCDRLHVKSEAWTTVAWCCPWEAQLWSCKRECCFYGASQRRVAVLKP